MKTFDLSSFPELAATLRRPYHDDYYAMYSSIYGGLVTDPVLMTLPADDHLVHRGDGIFETLKCTKGKLYNLEAHLDRLQEAARNLHFKLPMPISAISDTVIETTAAAGKPECLVRILVSRGPGSFGVNPYDSPGSQLYVIVSKLKRPFMESHPAGARVRTSAIASKAPFFARLKTCDYLPNVLMKKEAVDAGVDFVLAFDDRQCLTEGATENAGIVTADKALLFPRRETILDGTTMIRAMELASQLVECGELTRVNREDISREMLSAARELLIVGTTPNAIAVTEFDGNPVGNGKPGPIYQKLYDLLVEDTLSNQDLLTPVM